MRAVNYQTINQILKETYQLMDEATDLRRKLDNLLIHKFWGYVIFSDLDDHFQAIFDWSSVPMDFIDKSFARMVLAKKQMPEDLDDLIAEGIISGIGGIVIFIPQIAFFFCSFPS